MYSELPVEVEQEQIYHESIKRLKGQEVELARPMLVSTCDL